MPKRVLLVAALAAVAALGAAYVLRPPTGVPRDAPSLDRMAADIGTPVMDHLYKGHVPGRSGEIMLVPRPNNYLIGDWDLTTLGTATPTTSTSHPNPWNYLTRVPIVVYGPGYVSHSTNFDHVDIAGLAPTYAQILGMNDFDRDGTPLPGIETGDKPPKVIFTVVVDGGGWNALETHADSWPAIHALRESGTTFMNATIGSAPSITGALHATFGTGDYPIDHGIPGNQMRSPDGENVDTWNDDSDPQYLRVPALADVWDQDNGNVPIVATVSYEGWHLGMIGHGAQMEGGDKDIAVLWNADEERPPVNRWWINEDYYTLPDYLQTTDIAKLEAYERQLDERDGIEDGTWFGHTLEQLQEPLVRPGTPAFARFTGDAVMDILENEPIGKDDVTDLVWVEMKMPDYAGHAWNMINPEQGDVLLETDAQIGRYKKWLDKNVGPNNYILAVSADHGQQPLPDLEGGWRINSRELERDIEDRFGDVVEKVTPVDVYIDAEKLADEGYTTEDIARYVGTYTLGENIPENKPGSDLVPEGRMDELLFAGAFDTKYFESLTPEKIQSFGEGDYPESDFYVEPEGQG